MVSGAGPELTVVGSDAAKGGEQSPAQDEVTEPRNSGPGYGRLFAIGAVLALLALGLLAGQQYNRAESLASRVESLQVELGRVEGELLAHQTHLDAVRRGFSDLTAAFGRLQTLVDAEPTARPSPPGKIQPADAPRSGSGSGPE